MPPVKGYGVLEPYEAKVSRTVPRRGGGSNLSSLFYTDCSNNLYTI